MNLTLSLDESLATQLRQEASTRHLSPEQAALELLGGALGKIAEDGQQVRADTSETPPARELAGRSQRTDCAQAMRELSKAHTLADWRSEAPYRSIVTL